MKILLIEDSDSDAFIIEKALHDHMKDVDCTRADNLAGGEQALAEEKFDAVILDLGLPDSAGPADTYAHIVKCAQQAPIIVSTNIKDHALATSLVRDGAEDCMNKDMIAENPGHVRNVIAFAIERHATLQKTVKESEDKDAMLSCFMGGYSVADKK